MMFSASRHVFYEVCRVVLRRRNSPQDGFRTAFYLPCLCEFALLLCNGECPWFLE